MKVYGLPVGQGLDRRNAMAPAAGEGHIISAVQALAPRALHKPSQRLKLRFLLLFSVLNSCSVIT